MAVQTCSSEPFISRQLLLTPLSLLRFPALTIRYLHYLSLEPPANLPSSQTIAKCAPTQYAATLDAHIWPRRGSPAVRRHEKRVEPVLGTLGTISSVILGLENVMNARTQTSGLGLVGYCRPRSIDSKWCAINYQCFMYAMLMKTMGSVFRKRLFIKNSSMLDDMMGYSRLGFSMR